LIVFGEQPDKEEVLASKPFVSMSGDELNRGIGKERKDVYITNVRKCLGNDGEPQALREASIAHCTRVYLEAEFQQLRNANCLLVVGGDALRAVTGRSDIMKCHGSTWTIEEVEAMRAATSGS
jgi:uracil-DNA glycosylase family 4